MRRYSVSQLHREIGDLVDSRYPSIEVEGEVAQISVPGSGHAYLILRDAQGAQLSTVCWRSTWQNQRYRPQRGDKVVARGRLGVYAQRGNYQLYANVFSKAGGGDLARRIAEARARLESEGLLDPRRKRELPHMPRTVGVATSLTGAALQDFLKVSRQRFPAARVLVAGCTVQGRDAAASVLRAVDLLLHDGRSEVIVVTRGGGSKEDLLAFQDEQLARFLGHSPIPIISAVGHQVDTTLSDLVADAVAPTPSAGAMLALPDRRALIQAIDDRQLRLDIIMQRQLRARRHALQLLRSRLKDPQEQVRAADAKAKQLRERLDRAISGRLQLESGRVSAMRGRLDALNPRAVLGRGYAIVHGSDGVLSDLSELPSGSTVELETRAGRRGASLL